jgi:hypothetical protein
MMATGKLWGIFLSVVFNDYLCFDGFVKRPTSALCHISQSFNVRNVRLMITKFARLEFEPFTKPSHFGEFIKNRIHQLFDFLTFYEILKNSPFYKFVNHNASKNYLQAD